MSKKKGTYHHQAPARKDRCRYCSKEVEEGEDDELIHKASGRFACYPNAPDGTPKSGQVARRNDR